MNSRAPMRITSLVAAFLLAAACRSPQQGITQVSTLDTLQAGGYAGSHTLGEIKQYGDFAIGTFHALDGEMIMIYGDVYQVHGDGSVTLPHDSIRTPFAVTTDLQEDLTAEISTPMSKEKLQDYINRRVPDRRKYVFFYLRGTFLNARTRSVHAQRKPYRPLDEVLQYQTEFTFRDELGAVVGLRSPEFADGIHGAGFRMHFLNEARNAGGHVLDFTLSSGTLRADTEHDWLHVFLPEHTGARPYPDPRLAR